jgi:hypothetical protein
MTASMCLRRGSGSSARIGNLHGQAIAALISDSLMLLDVAMCVLRWRIAQITCADRGCSEESSRHRPIYFTFCDQALERRSNRRFAASLSQSRNSAVSIQRRQSSSPIYRNQFWTPIPRLRRQFCMPHERMTSPPHPLGGAATPEHRAGHR